MAPYLITYYDGTTQTVYDVCSDGRHKLKGYIKLTYKSHLKAQFTMAPWFGDRDDIQRIEPLRG